MTVGVVVIAVIGGLVWWQGWPGTAAAQDQSAQSQTVEVTRGTIQQTVSGSGTIRPQQQAELDFGVSGRVTKVGVEPGDVVAKGDVLARLDTVSLDAALASARAQLTAARTTAASDGGESSAQQAANTASVASAEADVTQAEQNLKAATLRATFAGTVADVTIEVGDQVGSSSSGGGTGSAGPSTSGTGGADSAASSAAVTVISPQKFLVEASVAAADVEQLKPGLQVTVTPSGASEAVYGTVSEVGKVAETSNSGAATYPLKVKITGEQKALYAGTSADISIVVKQLDDVLTVPTLAVTTEDGVTYVQKVDGSKVAKTRIEIGQTYGQSTEVTSGLSEGDQVRLTLGTIRRTTGGGNGQREGGMNGFPGGGMPDRVVQGGGFPGGGFPGGQ